MIDFPDNPTINQIFNSGFVVWQWDGSKWIAVGEPDSGGTVNTVTASDTPPAFPEYGNFWFDTAGGQLYIWWNDGTSSQWTTVINQAVGGSTGGSGTVNYPIMISQGGTGQVTAPAALSALGGAPLNSPVFTGQPSLPTDSIAVTQASGDSSTKLATTAFVKSLGYTAGGTAYLPLTGGTVTGPITLTNSSVRVNGAGGAYLFEESNNPAESWQLYGASHNAALYSYVAGTNVFTVSNAGVVRATGQVFAVGATLTSHLFLQGNYYIYINGVPLASNDVVSSGYNKIYDNTGNATLYLGGGATYTGNVYKQTVHTFTDRANLPIFSMSANSGVFTGNFQISGALSATAISATGNNASFLFDDRATPSTKWQLYATGGVARIWQGGDKLLINSSGNLVISGQLFINNQSTYSAVSADGAYTTLHPPDDGGGTGGVFVGTAAQAANIYRNVTHFFQSRNGGVEYAHMDAGGTTIGGMLYPTAGINIPTGRNITINGVNFCTNDAPNAGYNKIYDNTNAVTMWLGNGTDPTNWYTQNSHVFEDRAGTFAAQITSSGIRASGAIYIDDPRPVSLNYGGFLLLRGNNNVGVQTSLVNIIGAIQDGTPGGEAGDLLINTMHAGALATSLRLYNTLGLQIYGSNAWKPGGGLWADGSDIRLKKNILEYTTGLDAVMKLRPVTFEFNGRADTRDDGKVFVGLVADEAREVMPEMVGVVDRRLDPEDEHPAEILTLDATALIYALVNSIKTLEARIAKLEGVGA